MDDDWAVEDARSDDITGQTVCQEGDEAGPGDDDYLREEDELVNDDGEGEGDAP